MTEFHTTEINKAAVCIYLEEISGNHKISAYMLSRRCCNGTRSFSDFDGHSIHAGEYLALLDGALLGSYTNISTLFKELSWALNEFSPEFITVYYGENVQEEDANAASETLSGNFPDAEVSVFSGGQPVYYYMVSAE